MKSTLFASTLGVAVAAATLLTTWGRADASIDIAVLTGLVDLARFVP